MSTQFSKRPGHRERYLQRKHNNPLFSQSVISQAEIENARTEDAAEAELFLNHFRELVKRAVDFKPSADVDLVLKLKEQLDKTYEQCSGLPGDQTEIKTMLKRLLHVLMQAMWKGVADDMAAQEKLETEEQARVHHFELLEFPIISDLLRPDSLIEEHELVPTLLSESKPAMTFALQLFSAAQQITLVQNASDLLKAADAGHPIIQEAQQRLQDMQTLLTPQGERPN